MGAIAGLIRIDNAPADGALVSGMFECLQHRTSASPNIWSDQDAAFGFAPSRAEGDRQAKAQPLVTDDGTMVVVADARIDNRDELATALDMRPSGSTDVSDASVILAAFRRWGSDCTRRLIGDFAFVVWDRTRRTLFCARDVMGVRSLYYFHDGRTFAFATEVKALLSLPEVTGTIDEEHLAAFIVGDRLGGARTFYSGIRKLEPRQSLTVRNGACLYRTYWEWDAETELRLGSNTEYAEAFLDVFSTAVECRLRGANRPGSFLSGGLDSSSIACVARKLLLEQGGPELHTFSAIFPGLPDESLKRIDERQYVSAVLAKGNFSPHFIEADRLNPLDDIERAVHYVDGPLVGFNMYMHKAIYDSARENGVDVVLDGIDGDTVVSHGGARIAEAAKRLRLWELFRESRAIARRSSNAALTTRRVITNMALRPLNLIPSRPVSTTRGFAAEVSELNADFVKRWDIERRVRAVAQERSSFRSARRAHADGFVAPQYGLLLELADKVSNASGVEARYPFFDRRVMEFCLSLPAHQKLQDGWGRWVMRNALGGILPEEVRWRRSKSRLSPNFVRGVRARSKDAVDTLLAGPNRSAAAEVYDLDALSKRAHPDDDPNSTLAFNTLAVLTWLSEQGRSRPGDEDPGLHDVAC